MAALESSSPSSVSFPGSTGPYAIQTTSTAVLSRSNSISGRTQAPQIYNSSPNAKPLGRSQSRGHRHSRSLSNATPPLPLPLPPKRRESHGSSQSLSLPPTPNDGSISQLPDNPKDWSPSQLSVYLSSALRVKGGGAIPTPVAKDIAAFALREKLGGRAFLRLSEESLTSMGVNHLWREALLSASRTLRKKVLKGRIWGFGSPTDDMDEGDMPTRGHKRRVPSTVDEDAQEVASSPSPTNYRGGRIRGMIESIERSGSSTGSGGSDDADPEISVDERLEKELKEAGLWIGSDVEGDDLDAADLSGSSASDNEMNTEYHSRDSSGSQPPAYTRIRNPEALEEPSIEELLASEAAFIPESPSKEARTGAGGTLDEAPSWGAMMWERDADIVGGTQKRIVEPTVPHSARVRVINGGEHPSVHTMFGDANTVERDSKEGSPKADADAHALLQAFKVRLERMEKRLAELELRDEERERELTALREREKQRQEADEEERHRELMNRSKIDLAPDLDIYAGLEEDEDEDPVDVRWPRPARAPLVFGSAITPLIMPGQAQPITAADQPHSTKSKPKEKGSPRGTTAVAVEGEHDDPPLEMTPAADPSPSDLPSYVLLVGVGVCAVVLRVLFRKITTERRT